MNYVYTNRGVYFLISHFVLDITYEWKDMYYKYIEFHL